MMPPRKMPAFTKPSAKTVDAFARGVDGLPGVEHRTMFGYPSVFLNGNMLACVFQDRIMVRLAEADRADAVSSVGGKPFEPSPGRAMREYVELPPRVADDPSQLNAWLLRGHAYVAALPTKKKKKR
jgi:TfoX/Sxy family transcriptional regulator of competence genes